MTGARGGQQRIPRPSNVVEGAPSPWARLTPSQRTVTVADVRRRFADLPAPAPGVPIRPNSRDAAVLVAIFEEGGEARVVLTKRPEHLLNHRGDIAFPGGKIDPRFDASASDAALREAEEEIGLSRSSVEVIAELEHLATVVGPFVIAPFVGIVDGRPALAPAPGEVDRVFDVALADLLADGVHREEQWERVGHDSTAIHFFELDDETVWGATARILTGFLAHLTGVDPPV